MSNTVLVDQSSPDFLAERRRNRSRFSISWSVPDILGSKSEVVWNRAEFCRFLAPLFFWGGMAPKFWDIQYPSVHISDHAAKFLGDRLTKLEDLEGKRKKNISSKT